MDVSVEQEGSLDISIAPTLEALKQAPMLFIEKVKDVLIRELHLKLQGYIPSDAALASYPFLGDIPGLLANYRQALEVSVDGEDAALSINKGTLKNLGLPEDLSNLLEYGNSVIPPLPHIRATMLAMPSIVAQVTQEVGAII